MRYQLINLYTHESNTLILSMMVLAITANRNRHIILKTGTHYYLLKCTTLSALRLRRVFVLMFGKCLCITTNTTHHLILIRMATWFCVDGVPSVFFISTMEAPRRLEQRIEKDSINWPKLTCTYLV